MQYRSRENQKAPSSGIGLFAVTTTKIFDDNIFDTAPLTRPTRALNWVLESSVHQAIKLTDKLKNANQFVGVQRASVRDEVREVTYVVSNQDDGLFLYALRNGRVYSTECLDSINAVRRCHIVLRKFDGAPLVLYTAEDGKIFLNRKEITTAKGDIDFPFLTIDQPPIGFSAVGAPVSAFITYKSRSSGEIIFRTLDPMNLSVGVETAMQVSDVVGGADIAAVDKRVLMRFQVSNGAQLRSHYIESLDNGRSFGPLKLLDLAGLEFETELPSNAPMTLDYNSHVHIPVAVQNSDGTKLLDVLLNDDLVVSAIEAPSGFNYAIDAFPKMPAVTASFREGFGDGHLDGSGIIASFSHLGKLLVSNSQSGGYSFPDAMHLNYDMQGVYGFRSTECYTRGNAPNLVSMDYLFVEADNDSRPLSSELWIDTWDMPLPLPEIVCTLEKTSVVVEILKDGWFFPGQTSFEITPANTFITNVEYIGYRKVRLSFDDVDLAKGATLVFRTKNVFFYYEATTKIE